MASWKPEHYYLQDGARIEVGTTDLFFIFLVFPSLQAAFRKYFHRADPSQMKESYEVVVCHANVIRCVLAISPHSLYSIDIKF